MPNQYTARTFFTSSVMAGRARSLAAAVLLMSTGSVLAASLSPPMAGLQPNRRPALPMLNEGARPVEWYQQAFWGIEMPYPWSLRFVNDQGNWYSPFIAPGMTGRYDIRGWHRNGGSAAEGGKTGK